MCQAPPFFMTLFILGCAGSSLLLRLFSSCREQGVLSSCDRGYLIAVASPVVERRIDGTQVSAAVAP